MTTLLLLPLMLVAQDTENPFKEVAGKGFHRAVIQAAVKKVKADEMRRADLIRLRIAMMSPAFRKRAEDLAIIQIASSDDDLFGLPTDENGRIDRAKIDWDALADFIERLIPLIMMIIEAIIGGGV